MAEETTHSQQSNYSWNCLTRSSGVWFIIICYTYYKCFKKPKEANFTVWTFYRRIVTCDTNEQYKLIPFSLKKKKKVTFSPIWPDLILQCLCIFRIMWILQTVQYFFKKKKKKGKPIDTICLAAKSALKSTTTTSGEGDSRILSINIEKNTRVIFFFQQLPTQK